MDRRQQKTRSAIFSAFSDLLSKKSYTKITVQDIIDAANVGRTTFYAHFETKDELLREMCTEIFDHVIFDGLSAESSHDYSFSTGTPREIIPHILFHLRDNRKNIVGILSCESGELFLNYFKKYLNELISGWILEPPAWQSRNIPKDFLIDHVSGSFVNMVQWWIRHNMTQPPEELTAYFLSVMGPILTMDPDAETQSIVPVSRLKK